MRKSGGSWEKKVKIVYFILTIYVYSVMHTTQFFLFSFLFFDYRVRWSIYIAHYHFEKVIRVCLTGKLSVRANYLFPPDKLESLTSFLKVFYTTNTKCALSTVNRITDKWIWIFQITSGEFKILSGIIKFYIANVSRNYEQKST